MKNEVKTKPLFDRSLSILYFLLAWVARVKRVTSIAQGSLCHMIDLSRAMLHWLGFLLENGL